MSYVVRMFNKSHEGERNLFTALFSKFTFTLRQAENANIINGHDAIIVQITVHFQTLSSWRDSVFVSSYEIELV